MLLLVSVCNVSVQNVVDMLSFLCCFIVLAISEVADPFLESSCNLVLGSELLSPVLNVIKGLTLPRPAFWLF